MSSCSYIFCVWLVAAYEQLGFRATDSEQCVRGIRYIPMQRLMQNGSYQR